MLGGQGACPPPPLKNFGKNGAIWCILSVSKLVIINLKVNFFWDNKSTTQFFCYIFSKNNQDAHFGTKINTFTFYKEDLVGNSPRKPKKCKKWRLYSFHTRIEDISCNDVDLDSYWVGPDFFLLIWCNTAHFECVPNMLI